MDAIKLTAERVRVRDEEEAVELAYREGWTDGFPIIPPTPERVRRMIEGSTRAPSEVIGLVPPRMGRATVEKVAINAVMAGARPEYLPVILGALEAVLEEPFNLNGVQTTTHNAAPLIVVNGPLARDLDINGGHNCFGPGWRANATIGRALRLMLLNIGGAIPGVQDKATQGQPGKYTYCIRELEEANPWEPLHVERGYEAGESVVTVFAAEAPHSVGDHVSAGAEGILTTLADSMTTMGNNNSYVMGELMIVLCPEHAATIARSGWTKADIRRWLFEYARNPVGRLRQGGSFTREIAEMFWPKWVDPDDETQMVPMVHRPEDILIVVAGGAGKFSSFVPGWGDLGSRSVSKRVGPRH